MWQLSQRIITFDNETFLNIFVMKLLKKIGLILLLLIVLLIIVGFFLPGQYEVKETVEIDRSPEIVYFHAMNFKQREKWDPWLEKDPDTESSINTTQSGVGTTWQWEGEKIGAGKITVQKIVVNEQIVSRLQFFMNDTTEARVEWNFKPRKKNKTLVTWEVSGELQGIAERWTGIFMKGSLTNSLDKGLQNFKKYLESIPEAYSEQES
jgi:uncharacterized protein YndB with AHSA1/START domain